MNSNTDILESAAVANDNTPHSALPNPHSKGRANGKVARFPKVIRDQINNWLLDGFSYPDIIKRLGEHGKSLKPDNVSQWRKRGHQDWLVEQAFIARIRARQETPSELTRDFDATEVGHAALQLGTLHIFEAMRDLGSPRLSDGSASTDLSSSPRPSDGRGVRGEGCPVPRSAGEAGGEGHSEHRRTSKLDALLGGDSMAFARLLNALARASRETMLLQKYREACLRARAALQQLGDPNRKISEKTTRAIVRHVDSILGLRSMDSEYYHEPNSDQKTDAEPTDPHDAEVASATQTEQRDHETTDPAPPTNGH